MTVGCGKRETAPHARSEAPRRIQLPEPQNNTSKSATLSSTATEVHYAPDEDLEAIDVGLLSSAQRSIDISAYSLTDPNIVSTIELRAQSGVKVRIYRDHESTLEELRRESPPLILELSQTPNIEVRVKRSTVLAHLKAFSIDQHILRTGSANFSRSAEEHQDNDLIIIRDPNLVARFETKFDGMWSRSDNQTLAAPQGAP